MIKTFDGLTSRCETPRSWACSSASAIRAPHQATAAANERSAKADVPVRESSPDRDDQAPRPIPPRSAPRAPRNRRAPARESFCRKKACRSTEADVRRRCDTNRSARYAYVATARASAVRSSRTRADLEGDLTIPEPFFLGQINPRKRAATEFLNESEARQGRAGLGEASARSVLAEARQRGPAQDQAFDRPESSKSWMSSTRRNAESRSGNRSRNSVGSAGRPASRASRILHRRGRRAFRNKLRDGDRARIRRRRSRRFQNASSSRRKSASKTPCR